MIRWVAVIFIGLFVLYFLFPGLSRIGVGRLPGDILFKLFGRTLCLPFGSTVAWSALAFAVAELLKYICLSC
ncbi:DUF2905 domain-containing protein [soil metagenome]